MMQPWVWSWKGSITTYSQQLQITSSSYTFLCKDEKTKDFIISVKFKDMIWNVTIDTYPCLAPLLLSPSLSFSNHTKQSYPKLVRKSKPPKRLLKPSTKLKMKWEFGAFLLKLGCFCLFVKQNNTKIKREPLWSRSPHPSHQRRKKLQCNQ